MRAIEGYLKPLNDMAVAGALYNSGMGRNNSLGWRMR